MDLYALLLGLLVWVVYPMWLFAGAIDYLCHRRTDIALTSGVTESLLHVAQFLCLGAAFALAVFFEISPAVWTVMLLLVVAHSVLAFSDVSYTVGRRHIPALEQLVHGYMEVLPWIALLLLGILHWPSSQASSASQWFALKESMSLSSGVLLLGSFTVLAGVPILEELGRTLRTRAGIERASRDSRTEHCLPGPCVPGREYREYEQCAPDTD